MNKISKEQEKEFFFILEREKEKLEKVFLEIKLKDKNYSQLFNLAQSYFQDMKHFLEKQEYIKAFELGNYVWGLLDSLAITKSIIVPKEMYKWFKTNFN